MLSENTTVKRIYIVIFSLAMIMVFIGIPARNIMKGTNDKARYTPFSEDWNKLSGERVMIDDIMAGEYEGSITLEKKLPDDIHDTDSLCFESQNCNFIVTIDGEEVYRYMSKPNLTGMGYGIAFHEVGICAMDSGGTVAITLQRVRDDQARGRVMGVCICPAAEYIYRSSMDVVLQCSLCLVTVFFGVVLIIIHIVSAEKGMLPFDALALGSAAIIVGVWLFIDTNVMQLVTGRVYSYREIGKILPFTAGYPLIVFFNSMTKQKRSLFYHVGFWMTALFIFGIIYDRYRYDLDMMVSFSKLLGMYLVVMSVIVLIIAVDNVVYCSKNKIKADYRLFYAGMLAFFICGGLDIVKYILSYRKAAINGTFTMIGMTIFVLIMLISFLRWFMKDHEAIKRDRFINRALQYAISSNSPDENVKAMIAFLGKELEAKRFVIFEDQKNGKYRGTYEWYREGESSVSIEMMTMPYEGLVDKLHEVLDNNNHKLIIDNIDEYKNSIPSLYNVIKSNHIENLVLGPLEVGGNIFGVCGAINVPSKSKESIADIIDIISYFLSQLIIQREEQSRVLFYNYKDVLSGAGNHVSYRKYIEEELDTSQPFGYVRCDVTGLDEINVTQGFEVGDQIVVLISKSLMEVFGDSNVFRLNGTQFVAFGFESDEEYFYNDVERAKRLIKENGIEAAVASVYCIYGTKDINLVAKRVEYLIQESMT